MNVFNGAPPLLAKGRQMGIVGAVVYLYCFLMYFISGAWQYFLFIYFWCCRNPGESYSHHGQTGPGSLHALQAGDREGWPGGGHQQEIVEGDHERAQPAYLNHQCSLHPSHTVSTQTHSFNWWELQLEGCSAGAFVFRLCRSTLLITTVTRAFFVGHTVTGATVLP